MGYIDQDVMAELLEMEAVPVCNTLSSLLGRGAKIAVEEVSFTDADSLAMMLPHFNVVAEGMRRTEGIEAPQMYVFERQDIVRLTNFIMGIPVEADSPLDEIALSTLREVVFQCVEAAMDEVGDFLGKKIEGVLTRVAAYDSAERVCESLRLWKKEKGLIFLRFRLYIDGVMDSVVYGISNGRLPDLFGVPVEEAQPDKEKDAAETKKSRAVAVQEVYFPEFKYEPVEAVTDHIGEERKKIQDITLNVSVRIGGTVCSVKEILGLKEGQILTLDKQAGSPADVVVNGKFIGKGDVLVTDDKFAARITEIVSKRD